MKDRIVDITTYKNSSGSVNFVGLMRNAKRFDLLQNVFILSEGKMVQCKIVGIELPPIDNPEYKYKVELPNKFISPEDKRVSLNCEQIFSSIEEAEESALLELDKNYKLNKEYLNRFFDEYRKK